LDLSNSTKIDDAGLAYLGKGCKKLRYLSFLNNYRISDSGIKSLCGGCKQLRVLNLGGCEVSDEK